MKDIKDQIIEKQDELIQIETDYGIVSSSLQGLELPYGDRFNRLSNQRDNLINKSRKLRKEISDLKAELEKERINRFCWNCKSLVEYTKYGIPEYRCSICGAIEPSKREEQWKHYQNK